MMHVYHPPETRLSRKSLTWLTENIIEILILASMWFMYLYR